MVVIEAVMYLGLDVVNVVGEGVNAIIIVVIIKLLIYAIELVVLIMPIIMVIIKLNVPSHGIKFRVKVFILFMVSNAQVFPMAFRDSFHDVYLIKAYSTLIWFLIFTPTFILVVWVRFISILRVFQIHGFTIHFDFDF